MPTLRNLSSVYSFSENMEIRIASDRAGLAGPRPSRRAPGPHRPSDHLDTPTPETLGGSTLRPSVGRTRIYRFGEAYEGWGNA